MVVEIWELRSSVQGMEFGMRFSSYVTLWTEYQSDFKGRVVSDVHD